MQKVMFTGHLGKDSDLRVTPNGKSVLSFSVASSRSWKQDGEKKTETTWYKVTIWDKFAETMANYLSKGTKVLVEGRLQVDENGCPRTWIGKEDGKPHASFEVIAQNVELLSPKSNGDKPAEHAEVPAAKQEEGEDY